MDKRILNLTQYYATKEQVDDGVMEPSSEGKNIIRSLLTFDRLPALKEINNRANSIANLAVKESDAIGGSVHVAMVGGAGACEAPYLMSALECALLARGITPLYSFTERVVTDKCTPVGAVKESLYDHVVIRKTIYVHVGFVKMGVA